MGFSRQECWSGLPFSSLGDLPDPGIEPGSPALQADTLSSEPPDGGILRGRLFLDFPVVMYRYESWTRKKPEHGRIDAFEMW